MNKSSVVPPDPALRVLEPSAFALRLLRLANEPERAAEQVGEAVAANSRFATFLGRYAAGATAEDRPSPTTAAEAVARLGPEVVAGLALFCSLLAQYRQGTCRHFDYQHFWQKALATGTATRVLAEERQVDGQPGFVSGCLSRIGELALASAHPQAYGALLVEKLPPAERVAEEKKRFGLSATDLSLRLLSGWQLPGSSLEAIRETADRSIIRHQRPVSRKGRNLGLATLLARICLLELPLAETFAAAELEAEDLGIPLARFGLLFDRLVSSWKTSCELFQLPTVHCPTYHQLKTIDHAAREISQKQPPPLTFLMADDDPMTLIQLAKMLSGGNRLLLSAENGEQALVVARKHRPDIVITDLGMPRLGGVALCRKLRADKATAHSYIIVLTCSESEDDLVEAFDAGADDFVVKPFVPRVLQARISSGERLMRDQQTIQRNQQTIQQYAAKLAAANRKLQNMAMTDFLTGLPNRRNALLRLKNLVAEAKRYGEPLSCLLIDIDHFKRINDNYGHDSGDVVLKQLATLLAERARSYDIVSRWGGEEFLIICARSGAADSLQLAERLRRTVEQHTIRLADDVEIHTTISIGVATWTSILQHEEELIKDADTCLYQAKRNGRNRVEAATRNKLSRLPLS